MSVWLKILTATQEYDTKQTVPTLNLLGNETPLKTELPNCELTQPPSWSHKSFSSS